MRGSRLREDEKRRKEKGACPESTVSSGERENEEGRTRALNRERGALGPRVRCHRDGRGVHDESMCLLCGGRTRFDDSSPQVARVLSRNGPHAWVGQVRRLRSRGVDTYLMSPFFFGAPKGVGPYSTVCQKKNGSARTRPSFGLPVRLALRCLGGAEDAICDFLFCALLWLKTTTVEKGRERK